MIFRVISWYLGDLELPSAVGHNCCPQTLSKQCYADKPRQLLQLPHLLGFIAISQGCCGLSEELNWDTVFTDSRHISLPPFFSLVLRPSFTTATGPVVLCRMMGAEGRGLKTSLPEPVLSVPLLWSQHVMCLGGTCTSARTVIMYSPGKCPWGGAFPTSLDTAGPVILPFPAAKQLCYLQGPQMIPVSIWTK